jgi:Phage integrase family
VRADFLCRTRTGGPLDERNVAQQDFIRVLNAAKLPTDFRLYDLRHTAATLSLAAGIQPKVVSEMLGHASAAFTCVLPPAAPHAGFRRREGGKVADGPTAEEIARVAKFGTLLAH